MGWPIKVILEKATAAAGTCPFWCVGVEPAAALWRTIVGPFRVPLLLHAKTSPARVVQSLRPATHSQEAARSPHT